MLLMLHLFALPGRSAEDFSKWAYSSRFTFNTTFGGANVATVQSDFPMLVRLPSGHPAFAQAKADGSDLRFADADGTTALAYEIERWDKSTKKAEIWVRIPKIEGNSDKDSFLMYWGRSDAVSLSNGPAVFGTGSGAYFTYHLAEKGTIARANSAVPGQNATPVNFDGDEDREGLIGRCDSLDGSAYGDHLQLPSGYQDIGNGFTFSAWQWSANTSDYGRLLDIGNGNVADNLVIARFETSTNANAILFEGNRTGNRVTTNGGMEFGRWRHIAVTFQDRTLRVFVDGVQAAAGNSGVGLRAVNRARNYIGRSNWVADAYFQGKLDEMNFSRTVRSADWLRLSFESQKADARVLMETITPPRVFSLVASPRSDTVLEGASVTLTASLLADTVVQYAWLKAGSNTLAASGTLIPNGGALTASLAFPAITLSQAGAYTCRLTNGKDTLVTAAATVVVGENLALWAHSLKILFNTTPTGGDVSEAVGNLPVPLRLDAGNFNFAAASANGADIRLTDPDGTPLSHQVVHWDAAAKEGEVWVRVPIIDGNSETDFVTLHWGRAGAASTSDGKAVFRAEQSWLGAWHLNDGAGSDVADASPEGHTGKMTDVVTGQGGILGKAMAFNGLSSRVALPSQMTAGLKEWTVNLWVKETSPRACADAAELKCPALFGGEVDGQGKGDLRIVSNQGQLGLQTGLFGTDQPILTTAVLGDGRWHFVAASFDGTRIVLYEAGKAISSANAASRALEVVAFDIGNINWHNDTHTNAIQGFIDEVQLSTIGQSAGWVRLAYEVQRADGRTVNYGTILKVAPPTPAFSPGSGTYPGPLQVRLVSADADADLFYTMDGSAPKPGQAGTAAYAGPFELTRSARVTAVADRGGLTSPAVSADYSVVRMLRARDTLRPGEEGQLSGGHTLRYPPNDGGPAVLVQIDSSGAAVPAGFEAKGPLLSLAVAAPSAFPPLVLFFDPYQPPVSLFRISEGGRIDKVSATGSHGGFLDIGAEGIWFWGLDIQAPTLTLTAYPNLSADTLRVAFLPKDNVKNLACRLEWWSGTRDTTAWIPCPAGSPANLRTALKDPGLQALEVRVSVTDGSIAAHHPEGKAHALTVAHALPRKGIPVKLAGNRAWTLAALPFVGEGGIRIRDLQDANPGGALAAGLWRENPGNPAEGGYDILSGEDTLPVGGAVWLSAEKALATLALPPARALASDSLGVFPLRLARGWNLVGGPALRALPWVASRDDGDAYLRSPIKVLHRHTGTGYAETDSLRAWEGCFAYHHGGDTVVRLHPMPPEASNPALPVAKTSARFGAPGIPSGPGNPVLPGGVTWELRFPDGAALRLGARDWASDGPGIEDEPLPPDRAGPSVRPRLLRGGRAWGGDFVRFRSDQALRWTLVLSSGGGAPGDMRPAPAVPRLALPAAWEAWALTRNGRPGGVRLRLREGATLPAPGAIPAPAPGADTLLLLAGSPQTLSALPEWSLSREAPLLAEASVRRTPAGPALFLSLPGNAQVTWSAGSADGRRLAASGATGSPRSSGGSPMTLGPGWHQIPLSPPGGRPLPAGAFWVRLTARGEGWSLVRTLPFGTL